MKKAKATFGIVLLAVVLIATGVLVRSAVMENTVREIKKIDNIENMLRAGERADTFMYKFNVDEALKHYVVLVERWSDGELTRETKIFGQTEYLGDRSGEEYICFDYDTELTAGDGYRINGLWLKFRGAEFSNMLSGSYSAEEKHSTMLAGVGKAYKIKADEPVPMAIVCFGGSYREITPEDLEGGLGALTGQYDEIVLVSFVFSPSDVRELNERFS